MKRLMSLLLALMMVVSLIPQTFAAELPVEEDLLADTVVEEETDLPEEVPADDIIIEEEAEVIEDEVIEEEPLVPEEEPVIPEEPVVPEEEPVIPEEELDEESDALDAANPSVAAKEAFRQVHGNRAVPEQYLNAQALTLKYVALLKDMPIVPFQVDKANFSDGRTNLPTSYDSRSGGYVSPVDNQNPYANCWAHTTAAMLESSLLRQNQGTKNLSEHHLSYYMQGNAQDQFNLTSGDRNAYTDSSMTYLDGGHNLIFVSPALSGWTGMADESVFPDGYNFSSISRNNAWSRNSAIAENVYWIDSTDTNSIKNAVMNYGAVGCSMYFDEYCFDYDHNSHFQYAENRINHAVTIVGWNDNYSRTNFWDNYFDCMPTSNGAWLVKNSWGSNWGASGYFWMSYEDDSFLNSGQCYAVKAAKSNKYDYNYHYDGGQGTYYIGFYTDEKAANVYTLQGDANETLKAVNVGFASAGAQVSIQLYKNPSSSNPTSGTALLSTPVTFTSPSAGYFTIPLNKTVTLPKGTKVSVVVTALNRSQIFIDKTDDCGWLMCTSTTRAGQSFYNEYGSWKDVHNDSFAFRIKLLTSKAGAALAQPTPKVANVNSGIKISWNKVSGATQYKIYYKTTGSWQQLTTVGNVDNYVCTSVKPGTTYSFTVRAVNGSQMSTYHSGVSIVRLSQPAFRVANTASGIKISWDTVSGATQYKIYYKSTSGWKELKTVGKVNEYVSTGVAAGTNYTFTVKALCGSSMSSYHSGISITRLTQPSVKVQNVSNGVKITWGAVAGATQYKVYYKTTGSWKELNTVGKVTSYTSTGVASGTNYTFTVKALNGSSMSSYHSGVSLTHLRQPAAPTLQTTSSFIVCSWPAVSGAASYDVYRKDNGSSWVKVGSVNSPAYVDINGLVKGHTYTYTIRAVKGSSMSSYNTTGSSIKYNF